jgi:hypothetical protein
MGNTIEYDCEGKCDYYESVHNIGGRSIYSDKFKNKCCHCTRPTREKMGGKGIYPQAEGGFTIKGE